MHPGIHQFVRVIFYEISSFSSPQPPGRYQSDPQLPSLCSRGLVAPVKPQRKGDQAHGLHEASRGHKSGKNSPNGVKGQLGFHSLIYQEKKSVSPEDLHLEWGGLKEGQTYEFWVSSTTRVGEGTPTTRTRVATPTNNKGKED